MEESLLQDEIRESGPEALKTLNASERAGRMLEILRKHPGRRFARFVKEGCVHCGKCASSCHYYVSEKDSEHIPANKSMHVARILREHGGPIRRMFRSHGPDRFLDEDVRADLYKAAFENCSLCGRCSLSCPMGLNTRRTMYLARKMFASVGILHSGLDGPVQTAIGRSSHGHR